MLFAVFLSGKPPLPSASHQVEEAFNNCDFPYSYITTLAFYSFFESACDTEIFLLDKHDLRAFGHVHEITGRDDIDHAINEVIHLQIEHVDRHLAGV